ncbi:MAG: HAMP domain-containing protein, partial [Dehalococcoidia bacterium]|nr:HAMP domain-containing protein [Dehalococcoidia bacterium]
MRSIRWKLGGALLLVALLSVGMVAFLTYVSTAREFGHYLSRGTSMYAGRVASVLGQYYAEEQSWDGVGETLGEFWLPPGDYRLIVADSSRAVVGDTAGGWLGEDAAVVGLEDGASITVSGEEVGELYLMLPEGVSPGKALLFMRGMGGGPPTAGIAEHAFLSNVNRSLWTVALIAVGVAILLGLVLTRQITRPLQALRAGARRIAQGHLNHRVESASKDELGELAQSFNAMTVSLEENEKARRRLIADIAHELRTPLAVVEGTVDGILDGVFQPDAEHLGSIKEQTALLTRLIADLRDISLAESGQLKL